MMPGKKEGKKIDSSKVTIQKQIPSESILAKYLNCKLSVSTLKRMQENNIALGQFSRLDTGLSI